MRKNEERTKLHILQYESAEIQDDKKNMDAGGYEILDTSLDVEDDVF